MSNSRRQEEQRGAQRSQSVDLHQVMDGRPARGK